jgi:hypothetical protein
MKARHGITVAETTTTDILKANTLDFYNLSGHSKEFVDVIVMDIDFGNFPTRVDVDFANPDPSIFDNGHYIIIEGHMVQPFPLNRGTSSDPYIIPAEYGLGSSFYIYVGELIASIRFQGTITTPEMSVWEQNFDDNFRDKIQIFKNLDQLNITSEVMATSITASETVKADTVKAETVDVVNLTGHGKTFKDVSSPQFEYGNPKGWLLPGNHFLHNFWEIGSNRRAASEKGEDADQAYQRKTSD